jgi:Na+/H+ antiporter NhaD/arsenite permease-like protein
VLGLVFLLIAVRRIGVVRLRIWQIMLMGGLAVVVTGQIGAADAVRSVNADVILFLFGVFVIGRALEDSGYLARLAARFFGRARTVNGLIVFLIFGAGLLSALLMNDTLAIIGTPLALSISRKTEIPPKPLLLSLAFAVTIGSVASPIGNPQNLLIALHGGIRNPFITFFRFLFVPTLINLGLACWVISLFYGRQFMGRKAVYPEAPPADARQAGPARASLALLVSLVLLKVFIVFAGWSFDIKLTHIALISCLPVILFSPARLQVVRRIDWRTLVFFAAMFVLMESVWDSGYVQRAMASLGLNLASNAQIMAVSVTLSQLVSNVPLVALYLPVLTGLGGPVANLMALAAGSTIAGNLTVLGAASNVIIIQNAEGREGTSLTFWDFVKIGAPLTIINLAVYWAFLALAGG